MQLRLHLQVVLFLKVISILKVNPTLKLHQKRLLRQMGFGSLHFHKRQTILSENSRVAPLLQSENGGVGVAEWAG